MPSPSPPPPGNANISTRLYIYPLPHPYPPRAPIPYTPLLPSPNPLHLPPIPTEPTSTLVLTTPSSSFIDLRFLKPLSPLDGGALANTTAQRRGAWAGGEAEGGWRLEWGFAGRSASEVFELDGGDGDGDGERRDVRKSTWSHWVDSRWPVGSTDIPLDSGLMFDIPCNPAEPPPLTNGHNGSEVEQADADADAETQHEEEKKEYTLEHGSTSHSTYEELWLTIPIHAVPTPSYNHINPHIPLPTPLRNLCIHLSTSYTPISHSPLSAHSPQGESIRGSIIRLGQYCQGMLQRGDSVTVERWEYLRKFDASGEEIEGEGDWTRTGRIGEEFLPCLAVCERGGEMVLGGVVEGRGFVWVVEECVEW